MSKYRISRNIEGSLIQFIKDQTMLDWGNIPIVADFNRAYNQELPVISVRVETTNWERAEIGSNNLTSQIQVLINLFATNDGNRLDLKDYLINILKDGCPYYEYEVTKGRISDKKKVGYLRVIEINDNPENFNTPKSELDVHDRYRHLLNITVSTGKVL